MTLNEFREITKALKENYEKQLKSLDELHEKIMKIAIKTEHE